MPERFCFASRCETEWLFGRNRREFCRWQQVGAIPELVLDQDIARAGLPGDGGVGRPEVPLVAVAIAGIAFQGLYLWFCRPEFEPAPVAHGLGNIPEHEGLAVAVHGNLSVVSPDQDGIGYAQLGILADLPDDVTLEYRDSFIGGIGRDFIALLLGERERYADDEEDHEEPEGSNE